ncbi:hypothetical protein N0V93_008954 [Gnomoniopsis smithogilvyi]|uniref:Secreted protein n=1 Tax=Gnomoniopsis smithogilvyi TaxID=1191159 RepID=A0A9W8YM71_9PEZI|nr:hypothetical protein N0V93_008954 [Gnomoniopsis smithogilvyi]
MQFTTILFSLAALAVGADACAQYNRCKCHDDRTGLQNDAITEKACTNYQAWFKTWSGNVVRYSEVDNHACIQGGTSYLNNCEWDDQCKQAGGSHFYQWCWAKQENAW